MPLFLLRLQSWTRHELPLVRLHALRRLEEALEALEPAQVEGLLAGSETRDPWSASLAQRMRHTLAGLARARPAGPDQAAQARLLDALERAEEAPLWPEIVRQLCELSADPVPVLVRASSADEPSVRAAAAAAWSAAPGPEAVECLLSLMDDPSGEVARAAIRAIGRCRDERLARGLGRLARSERPDEVRAAAIRALARQETAAWESPEELAGPSAPPPVLAAALEAFPLGCAEPERAAGELARFLEHSQAVVRLSAAAASLPLGDEEAAVQRMRSAISSRSSEERRLAGARLGWVQESELLSSAAGVLSEEKDPLAQAGLMAGLEAVSPRFLEKLAPRMAARAAEPVASWAAELRGGAVAELAAAARSYAAEGDHARAQAALELAEKLTPDGAGPKAAGEFLLEHRRLEAAHRQLGLAHRLAPRDLKVTLQLAVASVQTLRWEQARALAGEILAGQPEASPWSVKAAKLLESLQKKSKAP